MSRWVWGWVLVVVASPAVAQKTDWGIRVVPKEGEKFLVPPATAYVDPSLRPVHVEVVGGGSGSLPANLRDIARIGARFGTVTSTHRTPEHNRRVGGVPNSYHLSGRAIDIARRPGVRHAQIAAELRRAGYNLVESLDEGDHSHFAFGRPGEVKRAAVVVEMANRPRLVEEGGKTRWKVVYAPASGGGNR